MTRKRYIKLMYAQLQMQHKEMLEKGEACLIVNPMGKMLKTALKSKIENKPINKGVTYQLKWDIIESVVNKYGSGKVAGR